ncbi:hypothetical protein [Klebsiella aerogenes]|uniref:hypothetical protein n=1 Tax=Klebsiella aerogenes TaxID=548 RepID=UPI002E33E60D|nr:hypothetical protein [Klebsiella aerogenes]
MYHDELTDPVSQEYRDPLFLSEGHSRVVLLFGLRQTGRAYVLEDSHAHIGPKNGEESVYMAIASNGEIVDAMLSCNPARQSVLVFLARQLGVEWLAARSEFLRMLIAEKWLDAARLLLSTTWAEQNYKQAWQYATVLVYGTRELDVMFDIKNM